KKSKLAQMFEGEQGRKMAETNARAALGMLYGDFFMETNLPEEDERQIRELIVAHLTKQMINSVNTIDKKATAGSMKEREQKENEALRDQVAEYLTYEELAVWDEYQATMEERGMRKGFDVQLNLISPGLTPENRELAVNVMVEEVMTLKAAAFEDPNAVVGANSAIEGQRKAFANTRERLAEELDEDQLGHYDRFVEYIESAMRMQAGMMEGGEEGAEGVQGEGARREADGRAGNRRSR
ncbi:hypothetical protein ACFL1X_11695, partial [Candidatus Hydrogenedentota bacterium]